MDWPTMTFIGVFVAVFILRDVQRGREIAELRERMEPFAEVVAASVNYFEQRQGGRHRIEDELRAERNLFDKVECLLKL